MTQSPPPPPPPRCTSTSCRTERWWAHRRWEQRCPLTVQPRREGLVCSTSTGHSVSNNDINMAHHTDKDTNPPQSGMSPPKGMVTCNGLPPITGNPRQKGIEALLGITTVAGTTSPPCTQLYTTWNIIFHNTFIWTELSGSGNSFPWLTWISHCLPSSVTYNLKQNSWSCFDKNFSSKHCSYHLLCPSNKCWLIHSSSSFSSNLGCC